MLRALALTIAAVGLIAATTPKLTPDAVKPVGNIAVASATYAGRPALKVTDQGPPDGQAEKLVVLDGTDFGDGEIELWVAGAPAAAGANPGARGFAGLMFRLSEDRRTGEAFYIRPTNGRADEQERRNHAVQYISAPDWPWERTRRETPSRYEAYADMEPGKWVRLRLVVSGAKARLFVNGADQPTLVVNDLKGGAGRRGAVALWIGPGTVAHFSGLTIRPAD
jgi:hypothetical protein